MGELERIHTNLLPIPATGELIDLDDPREVAKALESIRELKGLLEQARRRLVESLLEECQRQGTKTLHLEGMDAEVYGGTKIHWDLEKLWELPQAGLPAERMAELITEEVTYKVSARVAKHLEAANPAYAAIIEQARSHEPAPWSARVTVK